MSTDRAWKIISLLILGSLLIQVFPTLLVPFIAATAAVLAWLYLDIRRTDTDPDEDSEEKRHLFENRKKLSKTEELLRKHKEKNGLN